MKNRKILISGAGIAGPALAWWLVHLGFEPTVVERAPTPRDGGYMIDFWGVGYEVAERMGLRPVLLENGYGFEEMRIVDASGKAISGFDAKVFVAASAGRYISIPRGDLARILYDAVKDSVEFIFGDSISELRQGNDGVDVIFEKNAPRKFDLVIGADGLHSNVRSLAFDAREVDFKFLGYQVASFEAASYPHRDEAVYVSYNLPGRHIARYALRDGISAFLFLFAADSALPPNDFDAQRKLLHALYDGAGWESSEILSALDRATSLYFDSVSQVRMRRWSNGRIALLGDAASCPSLLAGQGSALAIAGAFGLAHFLAEADGDHTIAFQKYHDYLGKFILKKQRAAEKTGAWFAPRTELGLWLRNYATNVFRIPGLSELVAGSMFGDKLKLPE